MRSNNRIYSNLFNKNSLVFSLLLGVVFMSSCSPANSSSSSTPAPSPTPTSTAAATASTTTASGPVISSFSPAGGSVSIFPTSVSVTFSETNMDPTTTQNTANWSYNCSDQNGQTSTAPTSVVLSSSGVATLTLPTTTLTASGATCVLQASSNIVDTNNNELSGTMTASYVLQYSSGSYYAAVTSVEQYDRLYGKVPLDAVVYPTSTTAIPLSTISYSINTAIIGSSSVSSLGQSTFSFPTTNFPDGDYTLSINGTDSDGNYYSDIVPPLSVTIQNDHSLTPLSARGSTGGTAFSRAAPSGYVLFGLRVTYTPVSDAILAALFDVFGLPQNGAFISSIEPIWHPYYGQSTELVYGSTTGAVVYGVPGTVSGDLLCPSPSSNGAYAVSGFAGTAGTTYLNSLGIVCSQEYNSSNTVTITPIGASGGSAFSPTQCPSNTFVTLISGRADEYVDQIQGSCD